jgi:hypothetical protein
LLVEKSPDMLAYLLQRFLSASLVHCQKNLVLAVEGAVYVGIVVEAHDHDAGAMMYDL